MTTRQIIFVLTGILLLLSLALIPAWTDTQRLRDQYIKTQKEFTMLQEWKHAHTMQREEGTTVKRNNTEWFSRIDALSKEHLIHLLHFNINPEATEITLGFNASYIETLGFLDALAETPLQVKHFLIEGLENSPYEVKVETILCIKVTL